MAIVKFRRDPEEKVPYTALPNSLFEDDRISFKAKGVLCYLLSKPNNWVPQVTDLSNHGTEGRRAIWNAMRELKDFGYAKMEYYRSEDGKHLIGRGWIVRHTPKLGLVPVARGRCATPNSHINNERHITKKEAAGGNRRAAGGFGVVEDETQKDPRADKLVDMFFKFIYEEGHHRGNSHFGTKEKRKATRRKWRRAAEGLIQRNKGNTHYIKKVMDWYFDHYRSKGVGTYLAMTTFADVENFVKVEKAMARDTKQPIHEDLNGTSSGYVRNNNGVLVKHTVKEAVLDESES